MNKEIIEQIVILVEELAEELGHADIISSLYFIKLEIDKAIGRRMREIRHERDSI